MTLKLHWFLPALTPTGAWCDDAWLSTAMLSQVSERLKLWGETVTFHGDIYPDVRAGVGLVRGGAGTALRARWANPAPPRRTTQAVPLAARGTAR
jgi:hypothetical protein